MRRQLGVVGEYAEYESAWHRRVRAVAAQHGQRPDGVSCVPVDAIPPHMTWWAFEALHEKTFEALHEKNGGGRDWWGLT